MCKPATRRRRPEPPFDRAPTSDHFGSCALRDVLPAMRRVADPPSAAHRGERFWGDEGDGRDEMALFLPITTPARVYRPAYGTSPASAWTGARPPHSTSCCRTPRRASSEPRLYREDADGAGVIGLPVRAGGAPGGAELFESSAATEYVRNAGGRFTDLGVLAASDAGAAVDDRCRVWCEDWHGNARPLFLGRRTLALLGYELVEGRIDGGRVREVQRVPFAPQVTLLGARR